MHDIIFLPMRLQPMHIGHLELIVESSKLGKKTKILLYNTKTQNKQNPLTETQKLKILKKTIKLENLKNIEIISMPYIEKNENRLKFVEKNIKLTQNSLIVSGNKFVQKTYKNQYKIKTPQQILKTLNPITATKIRNLATQNQKYTHHLSSGSIHYLEEINLKINQNQ